jgi:uncharacterized protein (DUF433 family)
MDYSLSAALPSGTLHPLLDDDPEMMAAVHRLELRIKAQLRELYPTLEWDVKVAVRKPTATLWDSNTDIRPFKDLLMLVAKHVENISCSLEVLHGTPVLEGTRLPVYAVLRSIANGTVKAKNFTPEQIKAALKFAELLLAQATEG